MLDREETHLAYGQIIDAAEGHLADPPAAAHLRTCAECAQNVNDWRDACVEIAPIRAVTQPGPREPGCPSMEELASFAANSVDPAQSPAESIVRHMIDCERCASIVREAVEHETAETADAAPMALKSSSRDWRKRMAGTFAGRPASQPYRWRLIASAALVTVTAGSVVWWALARKSDPAVLLAKAYTAARPFEYRLPDAGYGPVTQKRGTNSAFDRPDSLITAEMEIRRQLDAHPTDPALLKLKGRDLIMANDYDGAIESLLAALERKPEDPDLLADLGTAYALRGDLEKRNSDYGQAVELFLRATKTQPANQRVLFNLALTYEKLWLVDEAIDSWRKLLDLNPPQGWRGEAEAHLARMEKIKQEKKKADDGVLHDPVRFLAAYGSGAPFDPLPYYDVFWIEWLPKAPLDQSARAASEVVARGFERFGETSLAETISRIGGQEKHPGVALLARAMELNRKGRTAMALSAARAAGPALLAERLPSAAQLSRVELAYALRRAAAPVECEQLAAVVIRSAGPRSPWVTGTAHLEHLTCVDMRGDLGAARAEAEATKVTLTQQHLWPVALRAKGFVTGIDQFSGNDGPVWDNAPDGLREYWTTPASIYRAQNFQFDLENAAVIRNWRESAVVFYRAAIRSTHLAGNPEIEASDRSDLARILQEMGSYQEVSRELDEVNRLLTSPDVEPDPEHDRARENLRWEARLRRAEAELATHSNRNVALELEDLAAHAADKPEELRMRVEQARGLAILSSGDWRKAEQAFSNAVELCRVRTQSMPLWVNRIPVLELAAPAYRNLTQIELNQEHKPSQALTTWRGFRPRSASPDPSITFALLPAGLVVWSERGAAIHARWTSGSPEELHKMSENFLKLCATPTSSLSEIRGLGNRLFRRLIAPELQTLGEGTVEIATEGWLSSIPFDALVDDSGDYLIQRHAFVENYGPERLPAHRAALAPGSLALVISVPSAVMPGHARLPLLVAADREAAEVVARFPHSVFFRESSLETLAALASHARLFHFAGHGWANGGNGALILPPGPNGEPRFITSRNLAQQNWSNCELAVLSACLTATGEERGAVNNQSLVQALLSAGARRVIAARWSVDSESTRALMDGFYTKLLSGARIPQALSGAAKAVSAAPNWSHPYFWAGFDVFGAA